jgi:hypothetical protein
MMDLKQWMYDRKSIQFKSKNSKSSKHNNSQRIAFLFDGRSDQNLKIVQDYMKKLQDKGKDVDYIFLTDHAEPEQISFQAFNRKSFNWYFIPKSNLLLDFIDTSFDILICFNIENIKELDSLVDLSSARFKVGVIKDHSENYNLVINPVKEQDWRDYIKTLEKTLAQLSTNPELV